MGDQSTFSDREMVALVTRFYDRARADPVLGPLFDDAIKDWDGHIALVADFWSSTLLRTGRYRGNPFMAHATLPLEPAHFDLWLGHFEAVAADCLPAALAEQAVAKARHMSRSIMAGLFTVPGHRFGAPRDA